MVGHLRPDKVEVDLDLCRLDGIVQSPAHENTFIQLALKPQIRPLQSVVCPYDVIILEFAGVPLAVAMDRGTSFTLRTVLRDKAFAEGESCAANQVYDPTISVTR